MTARWKDIERLKPLFVVGAPRSGTTLVREVLRSFAPVYLLPEEFQVLPKLVRMFEASMRPNQIADMLNGSAFAQHLKLRGVWPEQHVLAALMASGPPAEAFRALVLEIGAREGRPAPQFWGDKTPENIFHLPLIRRLWPTAHVVHVVRDPRDTVWSMHTAWGRSISRSAVTWRDAAQVTHSSSHTDTSFVIHYERLISSPESELARLASWLDIRTDAQGISDLLTHERWGHAAGAAGIRAHDGESGVYQSARKVTRIEQICYREMIEMGYQPVRATAPIRPSKVLVKLLGLADAIRVLRAYARERGWRAGASYKIRQWRLSRVGS